MVKEYGEVVGHLPFLARFVLVYFQAYSTKHGVALNKCRRKSAENDAMDITSYGGVRGGGEIALSSNFDQ